MPFRRREKQTERAKIDATPPWELRQRDEPQATTGPFDERDAPDDDIARVDLGALLIPIRPGIDLRVDMNEAQQVMAATMANQDGSVQLGAFAAPRNEGIWPEIRAEIAASIRNQPGAAVDEQDGPWGPELVGHLPAEGGVLPVRFVGVDGPRWFLRAMFVGRVVVEPATAEPFEQALRDIVVVRGNDPLPVRDPLPLRLPKEVAAQHTAGEADDLSDAGESRQP